MIDREYIDGLFTGKKFVDYDIRKFFHFDLPVITVMLTIIFRMIADLE
jgi:hypothetical protein